VRDVIRACSCGGGGAFDHACHQRCSTIAGESQARIARNARGQDGAGFREALRRAHVHDISRLVVIDAVTSKYETPVLKPEPAEAMTVY
jgi:hypothetical protein